MHFLIMCPFCQMEHFPLLASSSIVDLIWLIKKKRPSYFLLLRKEGSCLMLVFIMITVSENAGNLSSVFKTYEAAANELLKGH